MKKFVLFFVMAFIAVTSGIVSAQNTIDNPFFDQVAYSGAFGTTDWTSGWANFTPQTTVYPATTVTISAGDITTNTTWTASNVYLLNGWVYVKNGATLTIEPGTIIRGDKVNKGALIVERGAQLIAQGTASNPIIFTSNQPAGSRDYGDWGGVIICGNASINVTGGTGTIEGGVGSIFGGGATPNDADNSGILTYVRIEFPGIAFVSNNEINGLTMGGVGNGTTINHIQVSYSGDDSYEWFGGTVNTKYLIAFRGWDDEFDTDFGYRGMNQFLVSLRDPAIADVSGSNGFESDNDASGSTNSPFTQPIFSNVSFFGPLATPSTTINSNFKRSAHIRRNSRLNAYNTIFAGFPVGIMIDGSPTQSNATNNDLKIRNCFLAGMTTNHSPAAGSWTATDQQNWFNTASFENQTLTSVTALAITDPFNLSAPNFLPLSTSPVLTASYWYVPTYSVTGTVSYDNTAATLLGGCTVNLMNGATQVATTTTDNSGNFSFANVLAGTYTLQTSTTRAWGGVTILDVVISRKYAATLQTLSPFKVTAGDINQDGSLNILDAVMIQRRIATLSTPAWTAPNWVFETPSVTVSNANVVSNIKGAVSGDVKGMANPPAAN
jgi:hypothetical protein